MGSNPYQSPEAPNSPELDDDRPAGNSERSLLWSMVAPLLALLAGPAISVLFLALDVYVFEAHFYVTSYERLETLWAGLPIGIAAGAVGFVIVVARMAKK